MLYYEGDLVMGSVYAEITLKNAFDVGNCRRGSIKEEEIHQTTVQALVDTGAPTLIINEAIRRELGLELCGVRPTRMANDTRETIKIVEAAEVHCENREMTCQPWVISGSGEVLLGVIPLENMDLMVDPVNQVLTGVHGEEEVGYLVGVREG
jgi:clan AA aspartic protease